jgi:RNA polymerase sigma-70 factor (ECF subfamily)
MRFAAAKPRLSRDGTTIGESLSTPEAFADVFDRHFAAVHRYLARRAGADIADDLAAQTFTLAFANRRRYRDELGTARPWLLGIATNLLRDQARRDRRRLQTVERLHRERVSFVTTDDDGRLGSALTTLDPDQRDALLLHAVGELTYAEIAAALEVPIGTVRSRISRACAALRLELEPPASVAGERSNHA